MSSMIRGTFSSFTNRIVHISAFLVVKILCCKRLALWITRICSKGLARVIHQLEKSTREGTFGQDGPCNNRLPGSSRSSNNLISLSLPGTNPSYSRNRIAIRHNVIRAAPVGLAHHNPGALAPLPPSLEFTGPARSHVRTPTTSNCVSTLAPPGTPRVTKS